MAFWKDTVPPFDPEESRAHNSVVLNTSDPSYIVRILEDVLLPRYRVPYLLIRAGNVRVLLGDVSGAQDFFEEVRAFRISKAFFSFATTVPKTEHETLMLLLPLDGWLRLPLLLRAKMWSSMPGSSRTARR